VKKLETAVIAITILPLSYLYILVFFCGGTAVFSVAVTCFVRVVFACVMFAWNFYRYSCFKRCLCVEFAAFASTLILPESNGVFLMHLIFQTVADTTYFNLHLFLGFVLWIMDVLGVVLASSLKRTLSGHCCAVQNFEE